MTTDNCRNDGRAWSGESERHYAGAGRIFAITFKAALIGFTLGFVLAVPADSWVWLDMRVNVGLLIPTATFLCPVFACWKRKAFPYALFLTGQIFLVIALTAIYGFDSGALWSIPASLFREGFRFTDVPLRAAGLMVDGIFLGGNLLWIVLNMIWTDADYTVEKVK